MRSRSLWPLLTLIALAACSAAPTDSPAADRSPAAAPRAAITSNGTICARESIPGGYVVVSARNNTRCGAIRANAFNEYVLARPSGATFQICSVSPMPSGWVITQVTGANNCPESLQFGWTQNYYRIETLVGYRKLVCSISGIPAGWVATAADRSNTCTESRIAGQPQNRYAVNQVALFDRLSICTRLSSTPPGWVVTYVRTNSACPSASGAINLNQYDVDRLPARGQMAVCSFSIPAGWTIVSRSNTQACPSDARGGTVVIRRA